jgi:hypothetical protein
MNILAANSASRNLSLLGLPVVSSVVVVVGDISLGLRPEGAF